jgi:hypothetical protein
MRILLLKYLLNWFKERLLAQEFTNERSTLVECADYILENLRK